MTFKKWLRKIVLFPLSVIMAVPDGDGDDFNADTLREIAGPDERPLNERIMAFAGDGNAQFMSTKIPDAAASEDDAESADSRGNQGDDDESNGLDTASEDDDQSADSDEDEENAENTTGQEPEKGQEKGTKKRTLEERAAELAAKMVEDKLAAKESAAAAERPDFTVIDQEKVDSYIAEIESKIDDLRLEGKYSEARKLSRQLDQLDKDLEENEKKQAAYFQRQEAKQAEQGSVDAMREQLDQTAELFRQEMKIEPAVWEKMGQWFESHIANRPLLIEEFNETFHKKGKVAAIRFAHEYTLKHMGQETKNANNKKEQQKNNASRMTSSSTGKIGPVDLRKAKAEFDANPTPEAFTKYQEIKRRAKGA